MNPYFHITLYLAYLRVEDVILLVCVYHNNVVLDKGKDTIKVVFYFILKTGKIHLPPSQPVC